MTQKELNKIPEANPIHDLLGVPFYREDDPIFVIDENGAEWRFALRMSDGKKVKYQTR